MLGSSYVHRPHAHHALAISGFAEISSHHHYQPDLELLYLADVIKYHYERTALMCNR